MIRCRGSIAAALVALVLAGPAWADLDAVKAALDRGDSEAAAEQLQPLAEAGDAEAQTLLGKLYLKGTGVPANYSLAWSWFERGANGGNGEAQYQLGEMHWNGVGVPLNEHEAVKQYQAAADQGHEDAQLVLGLIYRDGRRQIPASPAKAHHYLRLAADQGNPEAVLALEEMFVSGTAPADAQQEFSSERETQALTEAERIRAALIQWIEFVNRAGGGQALRIGPDVVVAETADGFSVMIPDLVLTPESGAVIRAGTLRIKLTPQGELPEEPEQDLMADRRYQVEATLPDRIQIQQNLETYNLTIAASELTGLWLPALQTFAEGHMVLDGLALVDQAGHTLFTAGQAKSEIDLKETEPGVWSGPSTFELAEIAVFDRGGPQRLSVGRVYGGNRFRGLRLEDNRQLTMQMQTDPAGFFAGLLSGQIGDSWVKTLTGMMTYTAFEMGIEKLVVYDETGDAAMGGLGRMTFSAEANQEDAGGGLLRLAYGHDGLDVGDQVPGTGGALVPTKANLDLTLDHLPVEMLVRLMIETFGHMMVESAQAGEDPAQPPPGAMMAESTAKLSQALSEARTGLSVTLSLDTEASPLRLGGLLVAQSDAAYGAAGDFELSIGNLDQIMALIDAEPTLVAYLPVIQAFAGVAERSGDQGQAAKFRIAVQPDGAVLVNGHDAIELSVGGTAE